MKSLGIEIERSQWSEPFLNVVYKCGLPITLSHDAEIIVKAASDITADDLNTDRKFIALEKTSGGNIAFRETLQHPSVIKYIKSFNYKNVEFHNAPCVDGRFFTNFLAHIDDSRPPAKFITNEDYKKIELGWSILNYSRMNEILSLDLSEYLDEDDERPIDIFFAGTLSYDNLNGTRKSADIITEHRTKCVEILESINGYKTFILRAKTLPLERYNEITCHSKVIVSPWGWGEPCYRDFEAILAGCILIKPKTDFITSACGIFENGYCVWTKPDFSELVEDINIALKSFKAQKNKRIEARNSIITSINRLPLVIKSNLTIS